VAIWDRLTALIAGGALSRSAGTALDPVFETTRQRAQHERAVKVLDPATAAELRAKETTTEVDGIDLQGIDLQDDAQRHGVGTNRFDVLTELARTYPGVAQLLTLVQRADGGPDYRGISKAHFDSTMRRHGYRKEDIDAIYALTIDLLSIDQIANAVQQGHVPNDGILPDVDPTVIFPPGYEQPPAPDGDPPSHVPLTQIPIDPLHESTALGWDENRLKVLANLSGLPPGPDAILQMWNRNLIDEATVDAGIREGHMKTKWAHAFKRMRWHVLSAPEYAGLWLRGWITKQQAIRGGALTGATPEQMDLLYKNRGRPMAPVQAFTAWARKAPHPVGEGIPDRPGTFDFQDFKRAIQQSDIRTEYVEPLWAIRYAYPSLFIVNRLVLAGAIPAATAKDWLEKQRMAPEVITALEAYWGSQGAGAAGPYVGRAQTQLWGTVHRTFVARETNVTQARGAMSSLGIPKADQDVILQLWQNERDLTRKQLTPAQLKKAFNKAARNEATGQPWTLDETLAALVAQGYSVEGATDYLNIP
jgi:hypothetical protein